MKEPLALLLAAACGLWAWPVTAQNSEPPATSPPASATPAPTPAAPPAADPATERFPIAIRGVHLLEAVLLLAEQAQLRLELDPKLAAGLDASGQPTTRWTNEVSVSWESVSPREALHDLLERHDLATVLEPDGRTLRVTYRASAARPGTAPGASAAPTAAADTKPKEPELPPIHIDDLLVSDAIKSLARLADLNIQFDPHVSAGVDLEGKPAPFLTNVISIRWDHVTPENALESLLANHGLILRRDTNANIATVAFKPPPAQEPLIPRLYQLKYAHPTNIVTLLRPPTLSERSKAVADLRTSQIIVQATEKEHVTIAELLVQLDTPTKQVLIEARLMQTSRNPRSIKGIDWSGTLNEQNIRFGNARTAGEIRTTTPGAPVTTTTTLPSGRTVTSTGTGAGSSVTTLNSVVGNGGFSLDTARGIFPNVAFLNADGLSAALSFLNTDSDTEVVATPRAVTLDNEPAKLSVTLLYPNFKITPGTQTTPAGAEITYTNLGTTLEVTPRIAGDNQIQLKVMPEVANVDSVDRKTINSTVNEANVYAVRRIETTVLIPSGNTLVMGGLISDTVSRTFTKVPILGDIPIVGLAFRKEGKSRAKSNLIIFVTPTIIQDTDFQATPASGFLQSPPGPDAPAPEPSAWDSGKPHDWGRKKSTKATP